jgi:NTE family protein
MLVVLSRLKDIQHSSRTRLVTDYYQRLYEQDRIMKRLLDRLPDDLLEPAERTEKGRLAHMAAFAIIQLIYQQAA